MAGPIAPSVGAYGVRPASGAAAPEGLSERALDERYWGEAFAEALHVSAHSAALPAAFGQIVNRRK